jgi:nitronate monooxygenase
MTAPAFPTGLTRDAGCEVPIICGAMYPCSNPELVAAVSEAGGIGILQPISLTYVYGYDYREGIRRIKSLTSKPIGMNALIESRSRHYRTRMERWIDVALEEGVRFFITSLGKPDWVAARVHEAGGKVYHDVTERKWALKGVESGVDGLIAVNSRAGGHPGNATPEALIEDLGDLGLPVVCAGGIGTEAEYVHALELGYDGVQMGTRFIATSECRSSRAYKDAIVRANEEDIVRTERVTGVPLAVIRNRYIEAMGTSVGPLTRRLLRWRRTKHRMRAWLALKSVRKLKKSSLSPDDEGAHEYWQAGKSVAGIDSVESAGEIVRRFAAAAAHLAGGMERGADEAE